MIREAIEKSKGLDIMYEVKSAEEMEYEVSFDVIFCNSAFQWFKDPEKADKELLQSIEEEWKNWNSGTCEENIYPNFIEAIEMVERDKRTKEIFSHFKEPWFFLETAEEYKSLLEKCGFKVVF
jgi:trans-aconitate methyltransferase